jgi:hypothetical protein
VGGWLLVRERSPLRAKGPSHTSLGQRPGKRTHAPPQAPTARFIPSALAEPRRSTVRAGGVGAGVQPLGLTHGQPGALPQADMRPRRWRCGKLGDSARIFGHFVYLYFWGCTSATGVTPLLPNDLRKNEVLHKCYRVLQRPREVLQMPADRPPRCPPPVFLPPAHAPACFQGRFAIGLQIVA